MRHQAPPMPSEGGCRCEEGRSRTLRSPWRICIPTKNAARETFGTPHQDTTLATMGEDRIFQYEGKGMVDMSVEIDVPGSGFGERALAEKETRLAVVEKQRRELRLELEAAQ